MEKINKSDVDSLKCPHCEEDLNDAFLKKVLSTKEFDRLKKFRRNHKVQTDPCLFFCPDFKCNEVVKLEKEGDAKATCDTCGTEVCGLCGQNYHPSIKDCDQVLDAELEKWGAQKDMQKCKMCKFPVLKASGCNHMTCAICKYQWCWLCGAEYSSSHYAPFNPLGCPGLQSGNNTKQQFGFAKICFRRIRTLFLVILALPAVLLFAFPVFALDFMRNKCNCMSNLRYRHKCWYYIVCVILFPFLFAINVFIVWPLAAIALIPVLTYISCKYCSEMKRRRRITKDLLE
jgi:hypothetical protein